MFARIFITLLFCSAIFIKNSHGQSDIFGATKTPISTHLRISLITVGPGNNVLEALGHVCIRVIDSTRDGDWHDVVFNYGTFDYREAGFFGQMISGDLQYYLSIIKYNFFVDTVVTPDRSVEEQVLLLSEQQKLSLIKKLQKNALPENKYYKYNFFVDDCATRIYYIFLEAFGAGFELGPTLPADRDVTYADLCWPFYQYRHWERVGGGILFADRLSKAVKNNDAVYLPAYLSKGMETATLDGSKLCDDKVVLRKDTILLDHGINQPLLFTSAIALITIAVYSVKRLNRFRSLIEKAILFGTGLFGLILLYVWFGTNYNDAGDNLNVLWALPGNIAVPFLKPARRRSYAIVALALIGLLVTLNLLGVKYIPLTELFPLFLSLSIVFATMCIGKKK